MKHNLLALPRVILALVAANLTLSLALLVCVDVRWALWQSGVCLVGSLWALVLLTPRVQRLTARVPTALLAGFLGLLYFLPLLAHPRFLRHLLGIRTARLVHAHLLDELAHCPWFGSLPQELLLCTPDAIDINAPVHLASTFGLWALVVFCLLWFGLGLCFWQAHRRATTADRKRLVRLGACALLAPVIFNLARLVVAPLPRIAYAVPFLSVGFCATIASFLALALLLSALQPDSAPRPADEPHRHTLVNGLLAIALFATFAMAFVPRPSYPVPDYVKDYWHRQAQKANQPRYATVAQPRDPSRPHEWDIRLDPQSTKANRFIWNDRRLAQRLAEELALPQEEIARHLADPKRRYIRLLVTRDADLVERIRSSTADWRLIISER